MLSCLSFTASMSYLTMTLTSICVHVMVWSLVNAYTNSPSPSHAHTHTHTLKSINKRRKKRADLGQQTCLHAVEHSTFSSEPLRGRKQSLTLPVTKPQKLQKSTASIWLITECTVVPHLLLQNLHYYCSMHRITAVLVLLPQCPPCYSSRSFNAASVIIFTAGSTRIT